MFETSATIPDMNLTNKIVYITRKVPISGVNLLIKSGIKIRQWAREEVIPRDVLLKQIKGVDALFCLLTEKIDEKLIDEAGPKLSVICTMSVGYEHINLELCRKRNIKVGFTPDILTTATTELTLALLLSISRRIVEGFNAVKSGNWKAWNPEWMLGRGLNDSTVGIVGYGRIGQAVANCLWPLGVSRIIFSTRNMKDSLDDEENIENDIKQKKKIDQSVAENVTFEDLLAQSDFVLCTCSLNSTTQNLFNKASFSKMKKTAIFVNISRGAVVNQDDLYWALKNGIIWGAGLDVTVPEPMPTNHPLLTLSNCIITPHIGSATIKTRSDMSKFTAENIICGLLNQPMPGRIV